MEKCLDEGLVKSIGLSNSNSVQVQEIIDKGRIKPAVLQVRKVTSKHCRVNITVKLRNCIHIHLIDQ